jgi:hypothetical protein
MFKQNEIPKSINFLNPVDNPTNVWAHAYDWMFQIGKYMLIIVEIIALGVFISRFILDEKNNDLTKDINNQVAILSGGSWKQDSITYENIQALLVDIDRIGDGQKKNSTVINEVRNGIPSTLKVLSFSFSNGRFAINLETTNFKALKDYESALKNNGNYQGVVFRVTKNGSVYEISVNFSVGEINA